MKPLHLFIFAALHLTVAVGCLLIAISTAVLEGKLGGQCGIYMTVKSKSGSQFKTYPATPTTCQYIKVMPAIMFVFFLLFAIYHLHPAFLIMGRREPRYQVWPRVCWVITIVAAVFLFVAACMISVGFVKSCSELKGVFEEFNNLSCKKTFNSIRFNNNDVDESIYTFLQISETSSWTVFLANGVAITLSSVLLFVRRCKDTAS